MDVPNVSSTELFSRVQNYFTYNYVSGKDVIQTENKELGMIVGKGVWEKVHIGASILTTYVDTWHIVRVDVKEGRARIVITLSTYHKKIVGGNTAPIISDTSVSNEYPINPKGANKTIMLKSFYKSCLKAKDTISAIENALKGGSVSESLENDNW
ncbi:MAG: DUF4468 domain-containing protein [Rikenellaceae bacterium]